MNPNHVWKFYRTGGLDQVSLETGADLMSLDQLDQKLWVALSCPVKGLELDEKTLALIDTDRDGRIGIDFGVYGVPESFLIDKAGVIRYKQIGPVTNEALRDKILPLIRELQK